MEACEMEQTFLRYGYRELPVCIIHKPVYYGVRASLHCFLCGRTFLLKHIKGEGQHCFLESDLEVFIDGGDCYYELEVNAANTVYEVFFIWKDAYTKGSRFDIPQFDVHHPQAYTFGGDYDRVGATFWKGTLPAGHTVGFHAF